MKSNILHIKNMVCRRCVMTVENICRNLGIDDADVSLGMVEFKHNMDDNTRQMLDERLRQVGFEPIDSDEMITTETIKALIRNYARTRSLQSLKLSSYIAHEMGADFRYISRLFSSIEGRTIQKYLMLQRMEYVKELLLEPNITLAEIADVTGFSSVAHLSTSFKKVVGLTITDFKHEGTRTGIDLV